MGEQVNEYLKAQLLAVEGLPLDKIDAERAAKDKIKLTPDYINRTVESQIEDYIVRKEMVKSAVKAEVVEKKETKKYKKD